MTEAVAIKSVSAWPHARPECQQMIDWAQKKMEALGVTCEQVDIGMQTLPDGSKLKLPNVVMGTYGNVSEHCDLWGVWKRVLHLFKTLSRLTGS